MSGRGRGISNKPAWMTRNEAPGVGGMMDARAGGGGGPGPGPPNMMMDPYHDRGGPERFDRDRGGPPPPRGYNNNNDRGGPPPPRGGYGDRGGGGRYDDFRDRGGRDGRGGGGGDFRDHARPPSRGRDFDRRDRDFGPPPPQGGGRPDNINNNNRGGGGDRRGSGGGSNPIGTGSNTPNHKNPGTIFFRSYDEELQWVTDRRRKRLARKSKFDVEPTAEQAAADAAMIALSNPAATDFAGINAADRNFSAVPQQTRHARRLYIGQLPPNVTEEELHVFFRTAIEDAILPNSPGTDANGKLEEDPILSVYINHERRFCFLEFKSVEMTTACMDLDGIDIHGKGKVKVKRPNDYNPSMAPKASVLPQLDISRLGIVSGTVPDGPNKVFVGGLHYHLTEDQVLELLQAFGKVKAFHLVKNDPDSATSKGYCFAEYADPSVTHVAVMGLNGMDLGGGKMLTARGECGFIVFHVFPVWQVVVSIRDTTTYLAVAYLFLLP
jgi:RNA recognition motif-containing protein